MEKGLLVDLWGTLFYPGVDLQEYHRSRVRHLARALSENGLEVPEDAVREAYLKARDVADTLRGWTMREIDVTGEIVLMLRYLGVEPERKLVDRLVEAYMRPYLSLLRAAEGSAELLEWARSEGYKVALASNTLSARHTVELLRRNGLLGYFDFLALSDSIGYRKPHPRFFSYLITGIGVPPSESVFLGDEEPDIAGARSFGMLTIAFTGFHEYTGSVQPHAFASKMEEVLTLLRRGLKAF